MSPKQHLYLDCRQKKGQELEEFFDLGSTFWQWRSHLDCSFDGSKSYFIHSSPEFIYVYVWMKEWMKEPKSLYHIYAPCMECVPTFIKNQSHLQVWLFLSHGAFGNRYEIASSSDIFVRSKQKWTHGFLDSGILGCPTLVIVDAPALCSFPQAFSTLKSCRSRERMERSKPIAIKWCRRLVLFQC